ncbi:MAG: class I SAM-dependent methyltransferase [Eubacterium sp.]|nr:class I SAM-dependent methyltransferase [Eubacterium sp.]
MNEEKFTGKADNYAKYRPSYPDVLIDWLYDKTQAKTVVDIGAGTGIFTQCLLTKPWSVTAVEPNSEMLGKLKEALPEITTVQSSAENTGLSDNSADLITTAQAFHWFDEWIFKTECQRILTPGGKLAVIFNERTANGISKRRDDICMKYCKAYHAGRTGKRGNKEGDLFLRNEYFSEVEVFRAENNVKVDLERFIGDTLSRSYALSKSDEGYRQFVDELKKAFYEFEENGTVTVSYNTSCYLGTF